MKEIYNRSYLESIAKKTGFLVNNIEKVLRLIDLLEDINTHPEFAGQLCLKGGTAINMMLSNNPRLSVDIDLDYAKNLQKEEMSAVRNILKEKLIDHIENLGYSLSKKSREHFALDSLLLSYKNSNGNIDNIKIEINYIDRAHILPLKTKLLNLSISEKNFDVLIVNPIEIYASKTVALFSRKTPRDLYDVYFMFAFNIIKNMDLYRKCFIFYNMISGNEDADHLDFNSLNQYSFSEIRRNLNPMIKSSDVFDYKFAVDFVREKLKMVLLPNKEEIKFIKALRNNKYFPELLFDNGKIINRIKNHPMALWKTKKK